ncbi:hypothetical protein AVEN_450-1 [Araneus ventricosus]|uniref:Uncharacterized protein n=1 Tax=Araneus ventricosus TaxID=182803 RepID=A0A4Y2TC15_ARAVE|nr:hypothetical protein AVEN_450-1 [Araneus ventricosus]
MTKTTSKPAPFSKFQRHTSGRAFGLDEFTTQQARLYGCFMVESGFELGTRCSQSGESTTRPLRPYIKDLSQLDFAVQVTHTWAVI